MTTKLRLADLLEERGMSQSEVARQAKLSFQAVNHLCSGRAKAISLDTLDRLCQVLGVTPAELLHFVPRRSRS